MDPSDSADKSVPPIDVDVRHLCNVTFCSASTHLDTIRHPKNRLRIGKPADFPATLLGSTRHRLAMAFLPLSYQLISTRINSSLLIPSRNFPYHLFSPCTISYLPFPTHIFPKRLVGDSSRIWPFRFAVGIA